MHVLQLAVWTLHFDQPLRTPARFERVLCQSKSTETRAYGYKDAHISRTIDDALAGAGDTPGGRKQRGDSGSRIFEAEVLE